MHQRFVLRIRKWLAKRAVVMDVLVKCCVNQAPVQEGFQVCRSSSIRKNENLKVNQQNETKQNNIVDQDEMDVRLEAIGHILFILAGKGGFLSLSFLETKNRF